MFKTAVGSTSIPPDGGGSEQTEPGRCMDGPVSRFGAVATRTASHGVAGYVLARVLLPNSDDCPDTDESQGGRQRQNTDDSGRPGGHGCGVRELKQ